MKIDKVKDSFNTYKIELSYSEMMSAFKALAKSHADPVADEMFRGLQYYIERLPGPGEDKDEGEEEDVEINVENGDVDLDNLLPEPGGEEVELEPASGGEGEEEREIPSEEEPPAGQ